MPTNILMPALSPTMEKGNLAKWLKKEGDAIKAGDAIAEIETDKATMEVEAVDEGTLAKIVVPEGTMDVAVNAVIGVIAAEGEDAKSLGKTLALPEAAKQRKSTAPAQLSSKAVFPETREGLGVVVTHSSSASGRDVSARDRVEVSTKPDGKRVLASPLAKRLAKEFGIDIASVSGSGPHGRVVERDVQSATSGKAPGPSARAPIPIGSSDNIVRKLFAEGSFEEVPHDSIRKIIAQRLVEAKATIPHFYLTADCEIDALLSAREQINAAAPKDKDGDPAYKVSVNDMVIKAYAMALRAVPDANVSWTDGAMLRHKMVDVGVAVSIPGGLITPVVRDAGTKSLSAISNEMKDLAARAKTRRLKPEEYQGGTGAVSNLGMFGAKSFAAIINPPHATILAVGAGEPSAVVRNGKIVIATMMSLTLSTDHRAVDGALAAKLMQAIKDYIEKPVSMLL